MFSVFESRGFCSVTVLTRYQHVNMIQCNYNKMLEPIMSVVVVQGYFYQLQTCLSPKSKQ